MKKILIIFFAVFLSTSTIVFAKTLPDEKAAKDLTVKIMEKVATGKSDAAFKIMKPYTHLSPVEMDSIVLLSKESRERFGQRYGKALGYEFIDVKRVGNSLLRFRYIEKTEKQPLLWIFHFYRAKKQGWVLNAFDWNEIYKPLFDG